MRQGIEKVYTIFSVLFYIGILFVIYLYTIDNNTAVWIIAETMVVVGILSLVILDMLINTQLVDVRILVVRGIIINKYLIFCIVFMFLDKYYFLVNVLVGISILVALVLDVCLVKQVRKNCISVDKFINTLNEYDTSVVDKVLKYYAVYAISILLYLNIHSNLYEMGIMLIINIIVHCIVLNKVMKPIKSKAKWKIQLTLWTVFLLTIVTATYNYSMVTYSLVGIYVMVSMDVLQKKKTSLFTIDFFESDRKQNEGY